MTTEISSQTPATAELKSYAVEVKTQHGREGWKPFNTYQASSKGDAVKQAKYENWSGMCMSGEGLVWFRATEQI